MKFDWYQASIPGVSPQLVMDTLSASEYYGEWNETRPLKGYDVAAQFVIGSEVQFKINHGGSNTEYGANVLASGGAAPKLAQVIREHFPAHRVSRLDSCEDYHHENAYRHLRKIALRIAKDQDVYAWEIGKPLKQCDDGRTLYIGSPKSAIVGRIYEKGKQLDCGTEWVRAELQIRPKKEAKSFVSLMSPGDVWGLSKWSHSMAVAMGNSGLERVSASVYQQSDHDRAYRFMLKQYAKVFQQMNASHGSPEAVGAQIFYDLEHIHDLPEKASLTRFK